MRKQIMEMVVLCQAVNAPIVLFPGRAFPGILLQGDSLKIMADLSDGIVERLAAGDRIEAKSFAEQLRTN